MWSKSRCFGCARERSVVTAHARVGIVRPRIGHGGVSRDDLPRGGLLNPPLVPILGRRTTEAKQEPFLSAKPTSSVRGPLFKVPNHVHASARQVLAREFRSRIYSRSPAPPLFFESRGQLASRSQAPSPPPTHAPQVVCPARPPLNLAPTQAIAAPLLLPTPAACRCLFWPMANSPDI
jgi:hypothetical protein